MSNSNSSKQVLLSVIGIAIVIVTIVGVAFAFFNYTRTGSSNTIRVGRISFVTRQLDTINLTNVFPIDKANVDTDTDNVDSVVIEIEGDTDYSEGIEYLVSSSDANIYTASGTQVPVSLDIEVDDLGDGSTNYFTARDNTNASIYKQIVGDTLVGDQMLLVGYIVPNSVSGTSEGINGSITIKAFFDKDKILISDTYDGTESDNMGTTNNQAEGKTVLTTTEWNALQTNGVSFKIKVEANEGIWVNGSLEEIMRKSAVMDNINSDYVDNTTPGINFGAVSSDTNGKGVYMRAGTENDAYPIMYYRGAVENNNVIFSNKCWQAMRTTDTGGVKLIYNGELGHVYKDDNYELSAYGNVTRTGNLFEFDTNTNEWKVTLTVPTSGGNSGEANIKFTVAEAGNYTLKFNNPGSGPITAKRGVASLYPASGVNEIALNNLTTSEEINIAYTHYNAPGAQVVMTVALNKGQIDMGIGCASSGSASQISLNNTNTFKYNNDDNSPAYVGYMYGDVYITGSQDDLVSGVYYDNAFVWDGTNYTLTNNATTVLSNDAHYSCGETSKTATCTSIRYYYKSFSSFGYYILLTGGDGIEEALRKMNINATDSNAKEKIESWYENNLVDYTSKIEDTIYCNDRSMSNLNGFNPNDGILDISVNYGGYLRSPNYQATASPILSCPNKNDSFTWKNESGNRKLKYPIGIITVDELIIAGGRNGNPSSFYLNTGSYYWSMSPMNYDDNANVFSISDIGNLNNFNLNNYFVTASHGLRPVISIKQGQLITSGTGTVINPYVIG